MSQSSLTDLEGLFLRTAHDAVHAAFEDLGDSERARTALGDA